MLHNSDNLIPRTFLRVESDVLTDRILSRPVLASEVVIDDGDRLGFLSVLIGKGSAEKQRNAKGREIICGYDPDSAVRSRARSAPRAGL